MRNPSRRLIVSPKRTVTQNEFDLLNVQVNEVVVGQIQCTNVIVPDSGGG